MASILGSILNITLNSENPIAFINNQLEGFRKAKPSNRMLYNISLLYGLYKNITKEFLKLGLKPKSRNY
jgi:hypothetical protein